MLACFDNAAPIGVIIGAVNLYKTAGSCSAIEIIVCHAVLFEQTRICGIIISIQSACPHAGLCIAEIGFKIIVFSVDQMHSAGQALTVFGICISVSVRIETVCGFQSLVCANTVIIEIVPVTVNLVFENKLPAALKTVARISFKEVIFSVDISPNAKSVALTVVFRSVIISASVKRSRPYAGCKLTVYEIIFNAADSNVAFRADLCLCIEVVPIRADHLPARSGYAADVVIPIAVFFFKTRVRIYGAARAFAVYVVVAGGRDHGTPVNNGLTAFTVGATFVAVHSAGSILVQNGQLCIMLMPRVNNVVDHGLDTDVAAEGISDGAVGVLNLTGQNLAVHSDDGAVAGSILGLGGHRQTGHVVDSVPQPQADRNADQLGSRSVHILTVALNDQSQLVLGGVQAVANLEAVGHHDTLELPSVGGLQLQRGDHAIDVCNVCNIQIHVVDRIIFGAQAGVIVAAQRNGGLAFHNDIAGHTGQIAQMILDLKGDNVLAGEQVHIFAGQHLAGASDVGQLHAVHKDLAGGVIQLHVVGNGGREGHGVAGDNCVLVQRQSLISGGVAHIADGGQHSVVHSGGVVQSDVVNIEGVHSRHSGLDVAADEGGGTAVGSSSVGIQGGNIDITGQVDGCIDPAGFGNIRLSAGVQILLHTAGGGEHVVHLSGAGCTGRVADIQLGLESQTGSALGDVQPHTQGGGILAVFHITEHNAVVHIEQNVVAPAGIVGIGVVQAPCQSIFAVTDRIALGGVSDEGGGADLCVELASQGVAANQGVGNTVLLGPLLGILEAHEASQIAVFKVPNKLGALAVRDLEHVGYGRIGNIRSRYVYAFYSFIVGGNKNVSVQSCRGCVGKSKRVSAFNANSPVVRAVRAGKIDSHALAVRKNSFVEKEREYVGVNDVNSFFAHNLAVVEHLYLNCAFFTV